MLADLATGARSLANLPRFLRRPLTVAHARQIVHQRLETRQADFLALVARHVYGRASSPYRQLLQLAGCDLEEVLPHHFGGGPTDYQVVEGESPSGRPLLRLLVHPRVGAVDPDLVADKFLDAITVGSGAERVMGLNWRATGVLRVERRPPIRTEVGKILHLHVGAGVRESAR